MAHRIARLVLASSMVWLSGGVWLAGGALADSAESLLAQARGELDRLEFEAARETLARVEATGDSGPDELAEIYRLSGVVAGAYGDDEAAEAQFARWLALEPDAELGEGFAPKIATPFERARAHQAALRVARLASSDQQAVGLVVESDPLAMIAGARARFQTADGVTREVRASGESPYMLAIPRGVTGSITLSALDRHGNRLVELEFTAAPYVATSPDATPAEPGPRGSGRPVYAQWYVWGGLASSLAATSAYFGLRAQSDQRELDGLIRNSGDHEFSAALAVEVRGRRHARFANSSGIAAGAAGGLAAVFLIRQLLEQPSPESRPARAFLAPTRGGGAAGMELVF